MATISLTWKDLNIGEDGFNIYRSESPMDMNNMPAPIATVGENVGSYDDGSVVPETQYYYRIGVMRNGEELISEEESIFTAESPERMLVSRGINLFSVLDLSRIFWDNVTDISGIGGRIQKYENEYGGYGIDMILSDSASDSEANRRYGFSLFYESKPSDELNIEYDGGTIGNTPFHLVTINGETAFSSDNPTSGLQIISLQEFQFPAKIEIYVSDSQTSTNHNQKISRLYFN